MDAFPGKLVELLLVVGGVLAFGIWQLRSVDRDRRARLEREAAEARARERDAATGEGRDSD